MFTKIRSYCSPFFAALSARSKKMSIFSKKLLRSPLVVFSVWQERHLENHEGSEKAEVEKKVDVAFAFEWVTEVVTRVTADQLEIDPSEISLEKRFIKDLKADSLDIMEINMELEKELKIEVPDYCIGFIVTVEDAVIIIYRLLNGMELPHAKPD